MEAFSAKYSSRAFEGKMSVVFAAMVMQKDIALAHVDCRIQLAIAGKASTNNRMSAEAVETMGTELKELLLRQRDCCDGQRVLNRVPMVFLLPLLAAFGRLRQGGRLRAGSQAFDEQSGQLAILLDVIDLFEFRREHGCRVRLRGRRRGELMDVDDLSEFEDFITTTA